MRRDALASACMVTGSAIVVVSFLPLVRLGFFQRAHRVVSFLDLGAARVPLLIGAVGLIASGGVALVRPTGRVGAALALALAITVFVQAVELTAFLADGAQCTTYQVVHSNCGGPVLARTLRGIYLGDVRGRVRRHDVDEYYEASPRPALWLTLAAVVPLLPWLGYRVVRLLVRRRWLAIALYSCALALGTVFVLFYLAFANYGYD
jgi:hypothetical protein